MEHIVDEQNDGVRLDRFIRKKLKDSALSAIYKMMRNGDIKVNGKKKKQDYRLVLGDVILYPDTENVENCYEFMKLTDKMFEEIKKNIIFENDDCIVVNKMAGMVMHKGSGFDYGISEMYKSYLEFPEFAFGNRLDKATGGIVIGGKNQIAMRKIAEIIREREISKKYYLIIEGKMKEKKVLRESYLIKNGEKVSENFNGEGKKSSTLFKVIKEFGRYSLLEAELITGRTHQIRVHAAGMGNPIVGDGKYGNSTGKIMYLFAYNLKLEELKIDINIGIPEYFNKFIENNS